MVNAVLRLEAIHKSYNPGTPTEVEVLHGIDLELGEHEFCALMGPSGSGKSTLLNVMGLLDHPTSGRLFLSSSEATGLDDRALTRLRGRSIGFVFQYHHLIPAFTARENVLMPMLVDRGWPDAAMRSRADELLESVGLARWRDNLANKMSGGQQQRVAVARALVLEPQVLLFDEPLSNLDAKLRRRVREEIRELQQSLGLTVAYVTHDQQEALAVSDRIIVMSNARIAQIGAPRELYEAPRDRFVADFIGDANLVEAELGAHRGSRAPVRLGGLELELEHRGAAPGPVHVAIRPESIVLKKDASSPLRGVVKKTAYLGTHMEYTVEAPIGQLFVVDRDVSRPIPAGTEVSITLSDHGVALVPN